MKEERIGGYISITPKPLRALEHLQRMIIENTEGKSHPHTQEEMSLSLQC